MLMEDLDKLDCNKSCWSDNMKKRFPISSWLPRYTLETAKEDIIAGITVGLMIVPQALAYAKIANIPPVYGLYSAYIGVWTYIFFGTSKDISMGPTAILSAIVSGSANGDVAYAICLSLVCGCYTLVLGMLQQGWVVRLISFPTLGGFITAAAVRIIMGQIGAFLGIVGWESDGMVEVVESLLKKVNTIRWNDAELGFFALVVLIGFKQIQRVASRKYKEEFEINGETRKYCLLKILIVICYMKNIIVVVAATTVSYGIFKDATDPFLLVGPIEAGIQSVNVSFFSSFETKWRQLLLDGLVVATVALLEQVSIAKGFSKKNEYKISNSQEMVALGLANIMGSFFQCYPVTGSFSRSSVNSDTGSRTPANGLWCGIITLLALVVATPLFEYVPNSVLAAVIIAAVASMADFLMPIKMWSMRKLGSLTWFITFITVLFLSVEVGISVGLGCELLQVLVRNLRPDISARGDEEGIIVIEMMRGINFLGVEHLTNRVERIIGDEGREHEVLRPQQPIQFIIVDMMRVSEMDMTALQALKQMSSEAELKGILVLSFGLSEEFHEDFNEFGVNIDNFETVEDAFSAVKTMNSDENVVIYDRIDR